LEADRELGIIKSPASEKAKTEKLMAQLERKAWIYGLLVAVGVFGEAWYGVQVLTNSRYLRGVQKILDDQTTAETNAIKTQLANATDKLADVTKFSKESDERAAEANERAAQANQAAAESNERAKKIEYRLSPRSLTQETRNKLVAGLSIYPHQKFQVVLRGDPESQFFANNLQAALLNCGWSFDQSNVKYPGLPDNNIIDGIILITSPADDAPQGGEPTETFSAATALSKIIFVGFWQRSEDVPRGIIVVMIPPKMPDPETLKEIAKARMTPSLFYAGINAHFMYSDLRKYQNQKVSVYSPFQDDGAHKFAGEIATFLRLVHWDVITGPIPQQQNYPTTFGNVMVGISDADAQNENVLSAATDVLDALKKAKAAKNTDQLQVLEIPAGEICIKVGLSPYTVNP